MNRQLLFGILLFLGWSNLQAQEAISPAGGEASGSGGTASYTVGQVAYVLKSSNDGQSVAEGVQQPYEILIVAAVPIAGNIVLNATAYPNPATNYLSLTIDGYDNENWQYQLFDMSGKLIASEQITDAQTMIHLEKLASSTYLLNIVDTDTKQLIKQFKILKNK